MQRTRGASGSRRPTAGSCTAGWARSPTVATRSPGGRTTAVQSQGARSPRRAPPTTSGTRTARAPDVRRDEPDSDKQARSNGRSETSRWRSSATGRCLRATVRRDFLRYFKPGRMRAGTPTSRSLPESAGSCAGTRSRDSAPGFDPQCALRPNGCGTTSSGFTARGVMGVLAIAALLPLAVTAAGRPGRSSCRAVARRSCGGAALAMLLGTAATSEYVLRYLIPAVPLLVCGGVAATADLAALAARFVPLPLRGRARGRGSAGRPVAPTPRPSARVEEQHHAGHDHHRRDGDQRRGEAPPHLRTGSGPRSRTAGTRRPSQDPPASGWTAAGSGSGSAGSRRHGLSLGSRSADRSSSCPSCGGFCQPGAEPCL